MTYAKRIASRGAPYILALASWALLAPKGARAQDDWGDEGSWETPEGEPAEAPEMPAGSAETPGESEGPPVAQDGGTGIFGRVVDGSSGEGMIEAQVVVVGRTRAVTDIDGYFRIDLPPGTYSLRSFYELYEPKRIDGIRVDRGRRTEVTIELAPDTGQQQLQAIEIVAQADTTTAATQLQVRRQSSGVRDAVSAQEMARTPDTTASAAIRRVVAATVVGGQYLYVRGLGGRYTSVVLDNAILPQLDPDIPGVQLDLLPTNLLSSLAIMKTYSVELQGAFGGGAMLVESRAHPERFEWTIVTGLTGNTETTLRFGPTYEGGRLDRLGFDDGTRELPSRLERTPLATTASPEPGFRTVAERNEVARQFGANFDVRHPPAPPGFRLGGSIGNRVSLRGDRYLGYYLGALYRTQQQRTDETIRTYFIASCPADPEPCPPPEDRLATADDVQREAQTISTNLGVLGTATLGFGDNHGLTLTSLFSQSSDDTAMEDLGFNDERDQVLDVTRLQFVQRSLSFTQLRGRHATVFRRTDLNWRVNGMYAIRDEPDTRDYVYVVHPTGEREWAAQTPLDGQRLYFRLEQWDVGAGVDLKSRFDTLELRLGAAVNLSRRDYVARRLKYNRRAGGDYGAPPEDLFAPENSGTAWVLQELTQAQDSYRSIEDLYAAYASLEYRPIDRLRLIGGVRGEAFRQQVMPNRIFDGEIIDEDDFVRVFRTDVDPLPVANAVLELTESMYLRAGYSTTVARPRSRELARALIVDFVRRRNMYGDPTLQRTRIQNIDLRWEWFPGSTEVLAVTGFAKIFDDPIELVAIDGNGTVSFQNVASARNLGVELEARVGLHHLSDALRGFELGANATIVESEIELTPFQAARADNPNRPLAGQSPWTVNASIGYAQPDGGFQAFLYYNVFGKRIDTVGAGGLPDTYELPFHAVDLTMQFDFREHWSLKASFQNLAFSRMRLATGPEIARRVDLGATGTLTLTYTN